MAKMNLKRLKALIESLDQNSDNMYNNGSNDALTKDLIKINKAASKMKRLHSKIGFKKKFKK